MIEEKKDSVSMHERAYYTDSAFPVSMHIITKHDIFPKGRGFHDIHWHEEIQFTYVSKGTLVTQVEGKDYKLEAGEALFINSGLIHVTTNMSDDGEYVGFMFPEKLLGFFPGSRMEQDYVRPYLAGNRLPVLAIHKGTPKSDKVLDEIRKLRDLFNNKDNIPMYEYEVSVRLTYIWLMLIREALDNKCVRRVSGCYALRQERMKNMMQFIIDHYSEPITLNEIAESASVSIEECRRCFKDIIKETPVHYLGTYRVMMGMELLRTTDLDITDIAFRVGFNDSSYFIQAFKKKNGMTPKQYRSQEF